MIFLSLIFCISVPRLSCFLERGGGGVGRKGNLKFLDLKMWWREEFEKLLLLKTSTWHLKLLGK